MGLILQIFAQRARTREAKLQVQLAQLQYTLPRMTTARTRGAGMNSKGGSSGGGGAQLKGTGESQLEMDKRLLKEKISKIQKELEQVAATRDLQRKARKKRGGRP